jgi:hypothetical protein
MKIKSADPNVVCALPKIDEKITKIKVKRDFIIKSIFS